MNVLPLFLLALLALPGAAMAADLSPVEAEATNVLGVFAAQSLAAQRCDNLGLPSDIEVLDGKAQDLHWQILGKFHRKYLWALKVKMAEIKNRAGADYRYQFFRAYMNFMMTLQSSLAAEITPPFCANFAKELERRAARDWSYIEAIAKRG